MEFIISILILFILINSILKVSFWKLWQVMLFGLAGGIFIVLTYPYAIRQSRTQLADYLQNTTALKNMAVIITMESTICFAYCVAVLKGWFGQQEKWWVKPLKWYPGLLVFPVLFYLQTELIFHLSGISFPVIAYGFAIAFVFLLPLCCILFRYLLPEKELRLEVHFLVSLFVAFIGLLTTVNGNVTYQAARTSVDWKALSLAFCLFLLFFIIGMVWNSYKWSILQKRSQRKHKRAHKTIDSSPILKH